MNKKPTKRIVTTTKGRPTTMIKGFITGGLAGAAFLSGFGTNLGGAEGGKTIKKIYKK